MARRGGGECGRELRLTAFLRCPWVSWANPGAPSGNDESVTAWRDYAPARVSTTGMVRPAQLSRRAAELVTWLSDGPRPRNMDMQFREAVQGVKSVYFGIVSVQQVHAKQQPAPPVPVGNAGHIHALRGATLGLIHENRSLRLLEDLSGEINAQLHNTLCNGKSRKRKNPPANHHPSGVQQCGGSVQRPKRVICFSEC